MSKTAGLMLSGRFSEDGPLELSGGPTQLKALAHTLRSTSQRVEILLRKIDEVAPYEGNLETLLIEPVSGQFLIVSRKNKTLSFSGSQQVLASFADNVEFLADEGGDHLHIEYYPEHPFLDPSCASLVISSDI